MHRAQEETAKSIPTAPPKSVPTAPPKSIPTAPQHFLTLSGALSQRLTQASSATKIPIRTGIRPVSPCFTEKDLPPNTKPEDIARLTEKHVLERLPPTERKKYPSKRCKVCLSRTNSGRLQGRKYPKESSFHCPKCPSKPGLCMFPCYYIYHTKLNFWEVADAELEGAGGTPWPAGTVGMMQELGTGQSAKQRAEMEVAYFQEGSYSQEARNSFGSREGSVDHSFLTSPQLPGHGEPSSSMYGFSERAEGGQVVIKLEDDKKEDFGHLPLYGESVYGPTLP